ncbi:MAG TPA: MGMT family protein [Verrucomicrobiae bacterium]|nr:MGMT family protein [Verrucomicrobiae bacterium]
MYKDQQIDFKNDEKVSRNGISNKDVYDLLLKIPPGKVSTYRDVAKALGHPSSSRLIGKILGDNPDPIKVPCHRIVKSDGKIGGYKLGTEMKKELLEKEGISFVNETTVENFKNIRFYPQNFRGK